MPGCLSPDPGFCAGGDDVEPVEEFDEPEPFPVFPVPVFPFPVFPFPVFPVPVFPFPVFPFPLFPFPVFPFPVFPFPLLGGSLLGMRYDRGAAKGMSPDWPNVAIVAPPAPMNCPVLGRNTMGWVDPSPGSRREQECLREGIRSLCRGATWPRIVNTPAIGSYTAASVRSGSCRLDCR